MTVRLSTGLRNALIRGLSLTGAINNGYVKIFTGSQPATGDAAETGTLLGTVTKSGAALTKETRATATLTVTGGSGTYTAVTVGGVPIVDDPGLVSYLTSTSVTAQLLADIINRNGMAEATVSGAVVTVRPRPGLGADWNGVALAAAGVTTTGSNFASGVNPANGLIWAEPATGVIAKPAADSWSFTGVATGTAGWFRFYSSDTADTGAIISGAPFYPRLDGSCGVGSGDMQLASLTVTNGVSNSVTTASFTMPAQ